MRTAAGRWTKLCSTLLFITVDGFRAVSAGATGSVCYTRVESLDLGCLLRWDCPHASPNATYTVQTKTQGNRDPWQDVPWCVWISSRSCDVSQVFSNFQLYNMIRLGVHLDPGSTAWMKPSKFDYSDFTFSPPSVSVSLKEEQLLVKVQFPCASNRRCSVEGCCPVSQLIDPWTTVTLHNRLNLSDQQSRTVWSQELVSYVEFSGLSPGQNYCVVANFSFPTFSLAASPPSAPQCVETLPEAGRLPVEYLGVGLTFLLALTFLTVCLRKPRRDAADHENRPKASAAVRDPAPPAPLAPLDPCDVHLELADDPPTDRDLTSTLVHGGAPSYFPPSDAVCWDGGGISVPNASRSSRDE